MEVDRRHQHAGMPGKPLGEQDVLGRPVNLVDRGVAQPVERVPLVQARPFLPDREDLLGPAFREPPALGGEESSP